jgi:hypothetical protein
MYKRTLLIVTILVCLTCLATVYLNGQAHRYDIVAVGAGGGGSNEDKGDTEISAWLVDHKTGEVWAIEDGFVVPATRVGYDGHEIKKK